MHHVGWYNTTQEHGSHYHHYDDGGENDAHNEHPIGGDGFYHGGKANGMSLKYPNTSVKFDGKNHEKT